MSAEVVERHALSANWMSCLGPESNDEFAKDFEKNCGFLLGGVLWIAREAFHFDVMEKLVYPICGDWATLGISQRAWLDVQTGCLDISGNFDQMHELPSSVWAEDATDRTPAVFRERMATVSTNFGHYADSAQLTSQLVEGLIEVGKACADGLSLVISLISETLERIAIEASIPVVGWIAGAVEAGVFVTRFWNRVDHALQLIDKVLRTIERVITVLNKVIRVLKIIKTVLATTAGAMSISNSAHTPGAVEKGFGAT